MKLNSKPAERAIEYEQQILGILLQYGDSFYKVQQIFIPDAFSIESFRDIAYAIRSLSEKGTSIDPLTVKGELEKSGRPQGMAEIMALRDGVVNAANLAHHIFLINQRYLRKRISEISIEAKKSAVSPTKDIFDTIDGFTQEVFELQNLFNNERVSTAADSISETLNKIEENQKLLASGKLSGCPSGVAALDRATYGWQNGDFIIIAGNPGEGKTTLALQSAITTAEAGIPVYFISLEMPRQQLMLKQLSYYSGIDGQKLRVGNVQTQDWEEINRAATRIEKLTNFYIDETANVKFGQIKVKCRKFKALHKIGLIVVDYLQLVNSKDGRNKADDISLISKGFKTIAKELDVPVIVISSLSKQATSSGDKRPHPGHLKESGDIWYDADAVLTVYRPEVHQIDTFTAADGTEMNSEGLAVIDIWKQRMGSQAEVITQFIGRQNKFAEQSQPEIPKFNPVPPSQTDYLYGR